MAAAFRTNIYCGWKDKALSEDIQFSTKELDQFTKALKGQLSRVKIGILGAKSSRNDVEVEKGKSSKVNANSGKVPKALKDGFAVTTNAAVGALHEFGTEHMVARSFLRVPMLDHLSKELEKSGAFDEDQLKEIIKSGTLKPWLEVLGALGKGIVVEAFATGGYGKWASWKTKGYTNKTGQILKDTQQLSESITWDVK